MLAANPALKSNDSHSILVFDPRIESNFDPHTKSNFCFQSVSKFDLGKLDCVGTVLAVVA